MPTNTPRPGATETTEAAAQPVQAAGITRLDPTSGDWPVITRAQVADWTGHWLTEEQIARIAEQIGRSSVPAALSTIIASLAVYDDAVAAPIDDQAALADLVARYRAVAEEETRLYHSYPGTLDQIDAAVLPYEQTRDHIRDLLIGRGHAELAAALLRERDTLGVLREEIANGRAGDVPVSDRERAVSATRAVDRAAATPDGMNRRDSLAQLVVFFDDQMVSWPAGDGVDTAPLTATGRIDWTRTTPAAPESLAALLTPHVLYFRDRLAQIRADDDQIRFLPPDNPAGSPDFLVRPDQGAVFWLIEGTLFAAHLEPDGLICWTHLAEVDWSAIEKSNQSALRHIEHTLATTSWRL